MKYFVIRHNFSNELNIISLIRRLVLHRHITLCLFSPSHLDPAWEIATGIVTDLINILYSLRCRPGCLRKKKRGDASENKQMFYVIHRTLENFLSVLHTPSLYQKISLGCKKRGGGGIGWYPYIFIFLLSWSYCLPPKAAWRARTRVNLFCFLENCPEAVYSM